MSDQKPQKPKKPTFRLWPDPAPGQSYGPTPKQRLLFIEDLSPDERPHLHPLDIVLFIGGSRSGKSVSATARTISYCLKYPGVVCVIGAANYPLLERTALKLWEDRFTTAIPWDHLELPNRLITRRPTQNKKVVHFSNGSQAYFLHFNNPDILRGIDADIIWFEEACLLPDERSYEELVRRLSGRKGPVRQLILTTNPDDDGWIKEKFKLYQFRSDFMGEREPISPLCNCHVCQRCLNDDGKEYEFENRKCPKCGATKENDCPGRQDFMRVIQTGSTDNLHLPSDYVQTMQKSMDERTAAMFIKGESIELREGYVYKAFSEANVCREEIPLNMNSDIIWTLDFNLEPQCSVICQEEDTVDGVIVRVIDEIVKWNALPEQAAQAFCDHQEIAKWREAERWVYIYGDPAGLWGQGYDLAPSFYDTVRSVLTTNGFNVRVMMKRPDKNAPIREPVKIPVAGRVDAMNAMLCSAQDGELKHRLKINSRCQNLLKSLRELRVAEDGRSIDKKVDRNAQRRVDKSGPLLMSHPTDALGYYIYKRFPVLGQRKRSVLFQVPGVSALRLSPEGIEHINRTSKQEEVEARKAERRKARLERRLAREQKRAAKEGSLRALLESHGAWFG